MEFKEFSAKTVEEAIRKASIEFGKPSAELEITVIETGSNGFLGIGRKDAVIKAGIKAVEKAEPLKETKKETEKPVVNEEKKDNRPKIRTAQEIEARAIAAAEKAGNIASDEPKKEYKKKERRDGGRRKKEYHEKTPEIVESVPKPEREIPVRSPEEIDQMIKDADTFLSDAFKAMDIEVNKNISYDPETGYLSCDFEGDEMGIIIGKRGQTLDSLQYLTSLVVNKNQKEYVRIKLDTEEYRKRRKETLEILSKNIAYKVKKTRKSVSLEPMNPYERRIIHASLQNNKNVITYSEGEEPFRKVVIAYRKNR